ncbi:MAG: hypothetical protein IJ593_05820 [Lachnospiraceae bacterium]|nr:hypothetical protein [Lachnospiraceae bacterium]
MGFMADPKAGKANIKKNIPIPNHMLDETDEIYNKHSFVKKYDIKVEVSDYNSKPGTLEL